MHIVRYLMKKKGLSSHLTKKKFFLNKERKKCQIYKKKDNHD